MRAALAPLLLVLPALAAAAGFDGQSGRAPLAAEAPRFARAAPPPASAAKAPLGSQALDELSAVLADRASPATLADIARFRSSCLAWKPAALHVDCRRPRASYDIPSQAVFLATKFVVVMYGSRGYLVYVPAVPAEIRTGDDIRGASISLRDFLRAVEAAQRVQAQRAVDQARRNGAATPTR